jgi:uncharacterized protein (DUF1697 family)
VARLIVLLRGVNLAGRNRVAMPQLREALEESGFENVSTYVQSGNVVLSSTASAKGVVAEVERLISERFGLDIKVVVRTGAQLAAVEKRNPLGKVAKNPKLYQVTFLDRSPEPAAVEKLSAAATAGEEVVHEGLELYTWHPAGIGRSKLARLLSGKDLGASATARNWLTVTALLALADES